MLPVNGQPGSGNLNAQALRSRHLAEWRLLLFTIIEFSAALFAPLKSGIVMLSVRPEHRLRARFSFRQWNVTPIAVKFPMGLFIPLWSAILPRRLFDPIDELQTVNTLKVPCIVRNKSILVYDAKSRD